ncbi:MAG TPA: Gfo/Idh/MocA family oxidoreductase [Mycobacteriales bacterium]|nr:Gfo/Idh/MocA family oxidoreductase [Mycobacteriales bacterium]
MSSGTGLRVGVAGAGFIGRVHIASARRAGAEVVAVGASTPDRSQAVAQELGVPLGAGSVEELLAAELDVLHVTTPNHLHAPYALAALEAGVHVVLEKPVGLDPDEARTLLEAARQRELVVAVPFVYRFYPVVRHAREMVRGGEIGDLRLLHGHYLQDWLSSPGDANWRVDHTQGGASRAFADIGSHWCDLAQFVTGSRIVRVLARTSTVVAERSPASRESFAAPDLDGPTVAVQTEDVATLLFETATGVLGSVVVSQVSPGRKNRLWLEVDGSVSALAFDQENPEQLWVGGRAGSRTVVRDPVGLAPAAARYVTLPAGHPQGYADCFDAFVDDTYAAVTGDKPEGLPMLSDGCAAVALTDAVVRSARTQAWTDVEDL